jgi:hypothetical protein
MPKILDKPLRAHHRDGKIYVTMESGLEVSFPTAGNARLESGSPKQLDRIEISPLGLHWPDLDEDLSIRGILAGDFGQKPRRAA